MIYLRLYERNGQSLLGLLPEPISYQLSTEFSDIGAISFDYPTSGVNANLLTEFREVAVVDENGNEYTNARFVITNINRDRVNADGVITVTGRSVLARLDGALAYPDGGIASGALTRYFDAKNAGYILRTLIDSAQSRGALTGLYCEFTSAVDSNSITWADTVTQEYPARNTILSVLRSLQDYGIIEVATIGTNLKATRGDGLGTDRTTGLDPVVLRYGRNLTEAPEQRSADRVATVALVEGDGGLIVERTNSAGITAFGRIETSFTASGTDDTATANALGDTYLGNIATTARQLTVGLTFEEGAPRPMKDFAVGDYVYTATAAGLERVRVRQITVSMSGGTITASATLGDRIFENEIRTSRKLAAISSGSVALGNGNLIAPTVNVTPVLDTLAPSAPTSLTGTTSAYVEGIDPRAAVSLTWTNPTTNTDGSALTDLDLIEVQMRMLDTDEWQFAAVSYSAGARVSQLAVNTSYRFRVRAVDTSGNRSGVSNEFVITTANLTATEVTPSTPVVSSRLGTISIDWNGLGAGGGAMSSTFSYLAVHVSTTNNFTPNASTYQGRMNGADALVLSDLVYNTTYYVKFVAYNKSGVPSTASAQASSSIQPLVDTDIINNTISGAKITNGTITASDKIVANSITSSEIAALAITAGKIATNAITADKIEAGAVTSAKIEATAIDGKTITGATVRTSAGSSRVEMTSSGLFVYNAGTAVVSLNASGSASFTGTMNATSGYLGSASNGWSFTSTGFLQNSSGTTILWPSTSPGGNANTYAFFSDRGVYAERLYITNTTASSIFSLGGMTISGRISSGDGAFVVGINGNMTAVGSITASGAISTTSTITASGQINGNAEIYASQAVTNSVTAATNCFITSGGLIRKTSNTSSIRYKENVTDINNVPGLDPKALLDLKVVGFTYKQGHIPDTDDRAQQMLPGLIAEDVDAVYPIAADYEDGEIQTWNERMIIPGMLALIQDMSKELAEIKATLNGEPA